MHWNLRYSFALSSLKADKSIRWWFIFWSLTQWVLLVLLESTPLMLIVLSYRCSVSVRCIMTDVNLGNVVEVLDPLLSPTVYQLRRSVYFVVLPSVQYRSVFAAVQYSSSLHPWLFDDPSAMDCDHFSFLWVWLLRHGSKEFWTLQMMCLIRPIVLWLGRSQTSHWHIFNPSGTCFRQEGHWIVVEGLSQFDQLHVVHLVDSAIWFFTEDHFTFRQNVTNGFCVMIPFFNFLNFSLISFIFSSSCNIASWDTPGTRRSISYCCFFSQQLAQDPVQVSMY